MTAALDPRIHAYRDDLAAATFAPIITVEQIKIIDGLLCDTEGVVRRNTVLYLLTRSDTELEQCAVGWTRTGMGNSSLFSRRPHHAVWAFSYRRVTYPTLMCQPRLANPQPAASLLSIHPPLYARPSLAKRTAPEPLSPDMAVRWGGSRERCSERLSGCLVTLGKVSFSAPRHARIISSSIALATEGLR